MRRIRELHDDEDVGKNWYGQDDPSAVELRRDALAVIRHNYLSVEHDRRLREC
jgi:hypothetical protein